MLQGQGFVTGQSEVDIRSVLLPLFVIGLCRSVWFNVQGTISPRQWAHKENPSLLNLRSIFKSHCRSRTLSPMTHQQKYHIGAFLVLTSFGMQDHY